MKRKGTEPTAKLYKDKLAERMNQIYIEVQKRSLSAAERRKEIYDSKVKPKSFEAGDMILLRFDRVKHGESRKWSSQYIGPFEVLRRLNEVNYLIKRKAGGKVSVVHVDRMKKYYEKTTEPVSV
jgi:hypothetical protein